MVRSKVNQEFLQSIQGKDQERLLCVADEMKSAARMVLQGLRQSAGADCYEYHGSMNAVEWLLETANRWEDLTT